MAENKENLFLKLPTRCFAAWYVTIHLSTYSKADKSKKCTAKCIFLNLFTSVALHHVLAPYLLRISGQSTNCDVRSLKFSGEHPFIPFVTRKPRAQCHETKMSYFSPGQSAHSISTSLLFSDRFL